MKSQAGATWLFLILLVLSPLASQAQTRSTDDPLNPTIPSAVPKKIESEVRKKRRESNRRLIPKRSKRIKANTFSEATSPEDEATAEESAQEKGRSFGIGRIKIPFLDMKNSKAKKKGKRNVMGDPAELPRFTAVPPKGIAAYLGQSLAFEVAVTSTREEKVNLIWIVNSRVVCSGKRCLLPLDGEVVDAGATVLTVVAYHTGGSVQSDHILQVVEGRWKKGQKFNKRFVKRIRSKRQTPEKPTLDLQKEHIFAQSGTGVLAFPGTFWLLGDVGRQMKWTGRLRSNSTGVMKLISPSIGEWYVLRRSTIRFIKQESERHREVFVTRGGMRLRTQRRSEKGEVPLPLEDMGVETSEARIVATEGADVFVVKSFPSPAARKRGLTRSGTRVIVISGTAQVRLKKVKAGQDNNYNLTTGFELFVYEDGEVVPLTKPDPKRMERLLDITITPSEIAAEIAARNAEKAKGISLKQVIADVESHMKNEDYFEIIAAISPVASRFKEDVRLPYYMGVANKGLYQLTEAEKLLKTAHAQDPSYFQSAWELALLKMEEKRWDEAGEWLERAVDEMPAEDSRRAEHHYYSGVVNFQQSQDFSARSDFTRALWEPKLESSLVGSAGSFLKTLLERKGWNLVVPFGVQYDHNVLSLTGSEEVPAGFPSRSLLRSIAGGIFTSDPGPQAEKPGTYMGYGAKLMSINNFPRGFSSLDVILAEASLTQSFVSFSEAPPQKDKDGKEEKKGEKVKSITQVRESLGFVVLGSSLATSTLTLGLNLGGYDFDVQYEANFSNSPFGSDDSISFNQSKSFALAKWDAGALQLPVALKEKLTFQQTETSGPSVKATLSPTYLHTFSPRLSASALLKTEVDFQLRQNDTAFTLTAGPGVSATYFLAPWFLLLPGLSYDIISSPDKTDLVHKPVVSFLATALF